MLKKSSLVVDTQVEEDVYIGNEGDEYHTERSSGIFTQVVAFILKLKTPTL